jgi:hypothetical protein
MPVIARYQRFARPWLNASEFNNTALESANTCSDNQKCRSVLLSCSNSVQAIRCADQCCYCVQKVFKQSGVSISAAVVMFKQSGVPIRAAAAVLVMLLIIDSMAIVLQLTWYILCMHNGST